MLEKEAKERQLATLKQNTSVTEKIPPRTSDKNDGESRTQAAKLVGTNPPYVSDAKKIQQEARSATI